MRRVALALVLASSVAFAADEDPIENPRLPRMWRVQSRTKIPAEQTAAVGRKLGVELTSLENDVIDAGGVRVQVNLARCADEKQAETTATKFAEVHRGDRMYVASRGSDVAEIVCANRFVARKARDVLGWDADPRWCGPAVYEATAIVAPLLRCDGMRWNRLFNLLRASDDPKNAAAIEKEAKNFQFDDHFLGKTSDDPLPRLHGVPRMDLVARVTVSVFRTTTTADDTSKWTAATEWWPVAAPEVQAAAKQALGDDPPKTPRDRAERVLAWMHDHVRYGGDEVGSRYGTTKVIAQGFGHCWDLSDVFVALCRAVGVPARQVGGWLKGDEGHVWAEVVVGKKDGRDEVLDVDPGTTWLGVSEDYVRLWTSDDGRTPFVYWAAPKIEPIDAAK